MALDASALPAVFLAGTTLGLHRLDDGQHLLQLASVDGIAKSMREACQ